MSPPVLPRPIIDLMAQRAHRLHHFLWHEVRNNWLSYAPATQDAIRALGWEPPRPARQPSPAGPTPIYDNASGEDFLYMHRQMIALVNQRLAALGDPSYPRVRGWQPLPAPGDADYPVPPAWDTGDADLNSYLQETKSDAFFQQTMHPWEGHYADPAWLGGASLGELGARIEFTIHNRMHMRWCSEQDELRPDTDPTHPDTIDPRWDDPSYNWLGDTYSSHVHPWFWKIHGWVDDRIEDWKRAHGITGEIPWVGTWQGKVPENVAPRALHAFLTAEPGRMHHDHEVELKKLLKIVLGSGLRCHFYDRLVESRPQPPALAFRPAGAAARPFRGAGAALSALDLGRYAGLCQRLLQIDLLGKGPPPPPWQRPSLANVSKAIDRGRARLPAAYQTGYVEPLLGRLASAIGPGGQQAEAFAAPVYEHADGSEVLDSLRRFLAVISDMYRSFLSKAKRRAIDVPLRGQLPPVAFFQNDGAGGPYTIPCDDTHNAFGSNIGVVSLPSTYREHPFLWASLAHETGGHDVLHADPGLLEELAAGVRALFGGGPVEPGGAVNADQFLGLLWSYWIDETASDVYGLLNIGPQFALNLAAFFAALTGRWLKDHGRPLGNFPALRTDTGPGDRPPLLDEHPTDILRLHVAVGVVQELAGLSAGMRQAYVGALTRLADFCAHGATEVELTGVVQVAQVPATVELRGQKLPLVTMQESARRVGGYIATAKLRALGGHAVQEIETWDDGDESAAQQIAQALTMDQPVTELGDDAQLLAGATLALFEQPALYDKVAARLNAALDRSFEHDPIWGPPGADRVIALQRLTKSKEGNPQRRSRGKRVARVK